MNPFLSDLYFHCTEQMEIAQDPDQIMAIKEFSSLEQQLQGVMGEDFLFRYHKAEYLVHRRESEATFLQGLRFGAQFMQLLLGS